MSFRRRLTLFFVVIVIVPMAAVAIVLFRLIGNVEDGRSDARTASRLQDVIGLSAEERAQADRVAREIGGDRALGQALATGNGDAAARVVALRSQAGAGRVRVTRRERVVADTGSKNAIFPAARDLVDGGQRQVAQVEVSVQSAQDFARRIKRITGLEAVVRTSDDLLATTLPAAAKVDIPSSIGSVKIAGVVYRSASFRSAGFDGRDVQVSLLQSDEDSRSAAASGRRLAALLVVGFLLLALIGAMVVSRSLQRQIEEFLTAARRLGTGDFSAEVPTTGNDEFAALGEEFNKMSRELEARLRELGQERGRLALSMRRIGATFASNLDRDALLEIVVQTIVDGVGADGGHASVRGPASTLEQVSRVGVVGDLGDAVLAAEQRALERSHYSHEDRKGGSAIAYPLRVEAGGDDESTGPVVGLISVWRSGPAFTDDERDLLAYLAAQAAVSVENIGLHETIERQAVTDELTGLANRRRFQETIGSELERCKRFGQELGLVMLDIDDFKSVNDTYGHQQGDLVLQEIATILKEISRDVDVPARYGGEELAVVLPGTDLEGCYEFAERVRTGIEKLRLPIPGEKRKKLRISASFGIASAPATAESAPALIAAADGALYDAKRTGKNKTARPE